MKSTVNLRMRIGPLSFVFLILILILASSKAHAAKKIDGDRLFDPNRLLAIRIEMAQEDWQQLCRQSRDMRTAFTGLPSESPYSYFKANIWIDDLKIESVGIRKKGFLGSADGQRPSLKVKFDEFVENQDPLKGLSRLTLNNNKQDRSQASQFLTYELFRRAGNPAPRSNWAHVTVNGVNLGVYSHVESIKKPFLKRTFGDKSGNLYEGTLTDFHPKALEKIEVKTIEESNDLADIKRLAILLAEDGQLDVEQPNAIIDVDAFFRFWALESLTGFWDGYAANQNNFYLYFDPKDGGRGQFIPWGADWVMTNSSPFNRGGFGGRRDASVVYAQGILANRLYRSKGGEERYKATLRQVLDEAWDEKKMLAELDRIAELVSPKLHPAQAETAQALDEMRGFIRGRRAVVERALENWRPDVPAEPRKPTYLVDVGTASGEFETLFREGREAPEKGKAALVVKIDGDPVKLTGASAQAQLSGFRGFGGFGSPGGGGRPGAFGGPRGPGQSGNQDEPPPAPVNLTFTCERPGSAPMVFSFTIDREEFVPGDQALQVTGTYRDTDRGGFGQGGFGGFGGGSNRSVVGQIRLTQAGTSVGEVVAGTVDVRIVETHGGFFQQHRPGGGGFGPNRGTGNRTSGPGNSSPSFGGPQSTALQRALDTDRDGVISLQEMEQATASLKRLDRNGDGQLTRDEIQNNSGGPSAPSRSDRRQRPPMEERSEQRSRAEDRGAAVLPPKTTIPVVMTTQQDHQNMMKQLGITRLRPGPSGNSEDPNAANSDESEANPFSVLPELLVLKNGSKVASAGQWWEDRRPEIVEDFDREILGRVPDDVPEVKWEILRTVE